MKTPLPAQKIFDLKVYCQNILKSFFTIFLLLCSMEVSGQIAKFDFPTTNSLVVSQKDGNVTVSNFALSAGTIETNITTGTYFPNEPYIEETGGWNAATQSAGKNFNFTITAASGYQFTITNISFRAYATAAGPSAFGFAVGSANIYSVNAPDSALLIVDQPVTGQTNLTSANIRIQGWLNGSRSSAGSGVFRLDDVVITGTVTPISADTTPPAVLSLSPLDNATNIAINTNLELSFNENVKAGAGNLYIKRVSDDVAVQTIDITSGAVTFSGTTATINPPTDLAYNTDYYIEVDDTAITDWAGNAFVGISGNTAWNFKTALQTYNLTVTQATGGTISPGTSTVSDGANISFTAAPTSCYTFSNWVVDGANVGNANPYTFTNVTAPHSITAVYTAKTYNITATAGANGSISPNGVTPVDCGSIQTYAIKPDSGYAVDDVLVDGASVGAVTSYTFSNVATPHTISASFKVYVGPCFEENFDTVTTGDNTTTGGSPTAWTGNTNFPIVSTVYQAGGAIKLGSSSNKGSITSRSLTEVSGNVSVQFDIKGWSTVEGDIVVTMNGVSQTVTYAALMGNSFETKSINFFNVASGSTLKIETTAKRAFIDNVKIFCTPTSPNPEINLKQNTTDIASSTGEYNFGNQQVSTSSASITFTIENTGNADLTVGAITKSGGNAGDFTIDQSSTVSPVSGPGTTTFTVSFTPSGTGVRSTTISIPNNDADEAPYTFTVKGNGTYSALSTIVDNTDYSSTTPEFNIDTEYINFTDGSATPTGKFIPMKLKILDGPDSDDKNTILTDIKFTVTDLSAANRLAMIKTAILTTSGGTPIATATKSGNELVFSGMSGNSVTAFDEDGSGSGEKIIHLRVSIDETQVIDKTKLIFKVTSATSDPTGSSFAAADGGGAQSDATSTSTAAARNRLNVTATKLFFSTVSDGAVNVAIPAFTISATDVNNRVDTDVSGSVTISSVSGISGNIGFSLNNGVVSVNTIQFDAVQTGISLSGVSGVLNGISNTFNVVNEVYAQGTFMSNTTGTTASPLSYTTQATWTKCVQIGGCTGTTANIGGWSDYDGNGTPGATSKVLVRSVINNTVSNGAAEVTIISGGNLIISNNYPVSTLALVKSGGTLTIKGNFNFNNANAIFEVEDNAIVNIDYSYGNDPTAAIWDGKEKFHPISKFYIRNWDARQPLVNNNVDLFTEDGISAMFGSIYIEPGQDPNSNNGDYNSGIALQNWNMISENSTSPINLVHGNLEFNKTPYNTNSDSYRSLRLMGASNSIPYELNIFGSIILNSTFVGNVYGATIGNFTLNVGEDLRVNSGAFSVRASQTANGDTILNLKENLFVGDNGTFNLNQNVYPTANTPLRKAILNLKGNLTATTTSKILSGSPSLETEFNFNGTALQLVDVGSVIASVNKGIPVTVKNGTLVQLINNNVLINNGSSFTVEDGATLDFGYDGVNGAGSGGLYIGQPSSSAGTNTFTSAQNSILKITSPDGLYGNWDTAKFPSVTGETGNLRLPKSNRTINTLGTFWYIGKGDQKTGDAPNSTLSTTSNTKTVIVDLADNNKTLILDVPFGVSDTGLLDIRKGKVVETTVNYIFGSTGGLKMEPGTKYKIVKGDATEQTTEGSNGGTFIPRMQGAYTINGGEIELAGTGASDFFQTLRGSRTYYDLTFSGEGSKTLSNGTADINGLISIMNGTTLDGKSFTVGKSSTDLLMDTNSLFKTGGSGTKPDAGGDYVLDPTSTIEFQNNSATKVRITPYENMVVSGSNVEPGGLNLLVNQNTVVKSTGKLTVPETSDNENPYVVTAKKGIQIAEGGQAIFKNNANLMQEKDAVNTGNITMQRKATVPSVQYNYWSSPVKDQPLYSLYPGIPDNKVMVYNSANDRFTVLPTSSNPKSVFAKGYSIKGSLNTDYAPALTATFVGEPHNETTAGINNILLSTAGSNYNLIGNPYPSNLNLLALFADEDNKAKFYNVTSGPDIETPTAYFWDNTSNTDLTQQGSGYVNRNYALLNLSNGIGTPAPRLGTTGKKPNGIVKPGQGFIMRAAESGGSLTFKNTHRTSLTKPSGGTDGVYYKANEATTDKFWLTLTTPNQMNIVIALAYHPEAENSFERFDSMIFSEAVTENFYSLSSDARKLAIQSRKGDFNTEDKIPLGIKSSETGLQKISLESKYGAFENQPIYLKDKLLNTVVNLSEMPYEFTSVEGVDQNRFEIVYKPGTVLATDNGIKENLTVYRNANDFIVKSKHSRIDEVEVYDVSGRLIIKVKGGSDELRIDASSYISGTYVLKIKSDEKTVTKKILK